jgi:hypothetical protein
MRDFVAEQEAEQPEEQTVDQPEEQTAEQPEEQTVEQPEEQTAEHPEGDHLRRQIHSHPTMEEQKADGHRDAKDESRNHNSPDLLKSKNLYSFTEMLERISIPGGY